MTEADYIAAAAGQRAALELSQTEAAFAAVKQATVNNLLQTSAGQGEKRDRLILIAQITDAVRTALIETVASGKYGEAMVAAADQALAKQNLFRR